MCGICGFWGLSPTNKAQERLACMTESLAHRGPDGHAFWYGGHVGLGHRRLAVIDIEGGKQPMWDAKKKCVI